MNNSKTLSLGKFFYRLAEKSQDVFWIRDTDYKTVLYLSPAFEKIWGILPEKIFEGEIQWVETVHVHDRAQFEYDPLKEYRIVRPDQTIRYIQELSFPLYDEEHHLIGFAGTAKDVTADRQRMVELEEIEYFFKFFTGRIQTVFWARDYLCSKQLYLSPGYEKIWERSNQSLINNPNFWLESVHPDDQEIVSRTQRLRSLTEQGEKTEYELRYRIYTPSGKLKWIKDISFPIQDEKNQFVGFAGIAEDITKEMLHQQELREATERAQVANQAKSDFLAMISHELRTPLNAILGVTQILKMKELPQEMTDYVNIIHNAGNNLLALVGDILDFARLEAGKLSFNNEPFDLHDLFTQIVHSMQYLTRDKPVELSIKYPDNLPRLVVGDSTRVRQVLVNLVSNALKFTEKGEVCVLVDCIEQSAQSALFEITVSDTGIGIRPEKLKNLFEKFSQIDSIYHRKHRGIGLGLAITKQLVEAMQGKIQVKSEYNQGSEFRFTVLLKLQSEIQKTAQTIIENNEPVLHPQYHLNILLVEDNFINQKIARALLEDLGCRLDIIDNGRDVLAKAESLNQYDLILMDIGLPDLSGFDIVTQLRQKPWLNKIPIIAMTAHILESDKQLAFDAGMNDVLAKPVSYEEITGMLDKYAGLLGKLGLKNTLTQ